VTLSGSAAANSEVTVYSKGQLVGTTFATSAGVWSYTLIVIGPGTDKFSATDTNLAGDVSDPSKVFRIQITGRGLLITRSWDRSS
jgi:hypothetical protein